MTTMRGNESAATEAPIGRDPLPDRHDHDNEWRKGWPVVLAATIGFGCALAIFAMSAGLFIAPMRAEFGWSMSAVAFAPVVTLVASAMMPFGGVLIDRLGSRFIAIFGICLFAAAYMILATVPLTLPILYLLVACLGILGATGNAGPYVRCVATWFQRNSGSAFGVTMAGTSVVGITVVPVVALVVEAYGWRAGYLMLAAVLLFIALPLVIWLLHENPKAAQVAPRAASSAPAHGFRQALTDPRFWLLAAALGSAALPMGVFLTHLVPLLNSLGISLATAARYAGLFALAIGVGRVGAGVLVDRFWAYGVASGCVSIAALGCFAISSLDSHSSSWAMSAAIIAIGLSYGAEVNFAAYFSLKLFGLENFSKIFGCASLVMGGGIALGGIFGSALFDWAGSYAMVGPTAGALFMLSAIIMLLMGYRHGRPSPRPSA